LPTDRREPSQWKLARLAGQVTAQEVA